MSGGAAGAAGGGVGVGRFGGRLGGGEGGEEGEKGEGCEPHCVGDVRGRLMSYGMCFREAMEKPSSYFVAQRWIVQLGLWLVCLLRY